MVFTDIKRNMKTAMEKMTRKADSEKDEINKTIYSLQNS